MLRRPVAVVLAAAPLVLAAAIAPFGPVPPRAVKRPEPQPPALDLRARAAEIPLHFEPNVGQSDPEVLFLARAPRSALFLTAEEAVLSLTSPDGARRALRMRVEGAAPAPSVEPAEPLAARVNHFVGDDPADWHRGIPTYGSIRVAGVRPGVDLVFHGDRRRLEYDVVVHPGADPSSVALRFHGAESIRHEEDGGLALDLGGAELRQEPPFAYQEFQGERREVASAWEPRADGTYGFRVGEYDRTRTLVVDPVIVYSTYFGGIGADTGEDIAVDSSGRAYIVGSTTSSRLPTGEAHQGDLRGAQDAFVAKFERDGRSLVFATYLGGATDVNGSPSTTGRAIAVDGDGDAYVTGWTRTTDFPTTSGAFQEQAPGVERDAQGDPFDSNEDAFVTKLSSAGDLVWSTYLGGTGDFPDEINAEDFGTGIAVDSGGHAFVTGQTRSTAFPTTAAAFQSVDPDASRFGGAIFGNANDVFVTRLDDDGSALLYSTYLGGTSDDGGPAGRIAGGTGSIDLDPSGNAFVAGRTESTDFPTTTRAFRATRAGGYDLFVARLGRFTGDDGLTFLLTYSTYLGGVADEAASRATSEVGVSAGRLGRVVVASDTRSFDFPVTSDAFQTTLRGPTDAVVAKVDTTASRAASLEFSTFLGGSGEDSATDVAVESSGSAYVVGRTASIDFPLADHVQEFLAGGDDAFVTKVSPGGSALFLSTYLGGRGNDGAAGVAVQSPDDVFLTGLTASADFPVTTDRFQGAFSGGASDAFVAKLSDEREPAAHDLALLRVVAPRRVRLTDRMPVRTVLVSVRIQSRSTHAETIPDLETLDRMITLTVESMGACPPPQPVLRRGRQERRFPVTLQPGDRFTAFYDVTFSCANDPAKTKRADPGHDDYTYRAVVTHAALDGQPDDHPVDDVCPRPNTSERDPFPDGSIPVGGCEAPLTDVEDRRSAE